MDPVERHEIVIDGRRFRDWADLEDFCGIFPEFEDSIPAWRVMDDGMDAYLAAAELEFGDGNRQMPHALCFGWYGEVLLESDG